MVELLFYTFIGSVGGMVVGAAPGLSVTMATALLLSLTYNMGLTAALGMMMGVYVSGVFSGAISAILINVPGAPSSVATTLDGYPMARRGEGRYAIFLSVVCSVFGGLFGFLALFLLSKPLEAVAFHFTYLDYFLLAVMGLFTAGAISGDNKVKGFIAVLLGLLLGTVGLDPIVGGERFTFGISSLLSGIPLTPALIGIFGLSEVITVMARKGHRTTKTTDTGNAKLSLKGLMRHFPLALRSSAVGVTIGALPGAGSPVASLLSYNMAKQSVKKPSHPFGEGAHEGIIASEAANNACVGGALIPLLTLGIPGDAVTAIMLSALTIHGVGPGPLLMENSPEVFTLILIGGVISCVWMAILGLVTMPLLAKVAAVPSSVLMPITGGLCFLGAYLSDGKMSDVVIMAVIGVLVAMLRRVGIPTAPLALGLVLSPLIDQNLRRSISIAAGGNGIDLSPIISPATYVLMILLFATIYFTMLRGKIFLKKR